VSFVTGLIPCPGAAVILAFAIGLNIFWTGVAALLAMALGMGLTTTLFAWFAVSARKAALTLSGRNRRLFNYVHAGLSICGAAAIGLFGTALFIGSLTA
jgi:ABC-type nickel/cobalt efflux system permease component RcnA